MEIDIREAILPASGTSMVVMVSICAEIESFVHIAMANVILDHFSTIEASGGVFFADFLDVNGADRGNLRVVNELSRQTNLIATDL